MEVSFDSLNRFFEEVKSLGFWQRVFKWSRIKALSYDAYDEFNKLISSISHQKEEIAALHQRIIELEKQHEGLSSKVENVPNLEHKIRNLENENMGLIRQQVELNKKMSEYEQSEDHRLKEYQRNMSIVHTVQKGLEGDRKKIHDDLLQERTLHFNKMKVQWKDHQNDVENRIKKICQNQIIEYVAKVPFRGSPDNTIKILDEYIIFDAKSPARDDLDNFPKYIKNQTETVKKYVNQQSVKKDIFLVIPTNTLDVIKQFSYNLGDYYVYVISIDSLEPIILSLKRIENYEFAEQLAPEDRENICRIIGKFAHTTKRKIQIDYFFSHQFLEILTKCKTDLPEDILKSVIEFEKAEKLNPPTEKRAKQILTKQLIEDNDRLAVEARAKLMDTSSIHE